MASQVCEVGQFEKFASSGRMIDIFSFERPGEVVRNEDGVESCGEGGVDVRFGAVANHPCSACLAAVMRGEAAIGSIVLFGKYLDRAEIGGETGATELVGLLGRISLSDENEAVAAGEIGQRFGNVRKKFDLLIGDGLGKADDASVFIRCNGAVRKLFEAGDERVAKAVEAVAASGDGRPFDAVEAFTNLLGVVDSVVEIRDERGDGLLKVDIVFPKGVICIDKQGLVDRITDGLSVAVHWG